MAKKLMNPLERARLQKITDDLIVTLPSPEFLEQARKVKNSPESERLKAAAMYLSPQGLRAAGLNIPTDFRISSRYFDETTPVALELGDVLPSGRTNPVDTILKTDADFLDKLKLTSPELLKDLLKKGRPRKDWDIFNPDGSPVQWGACAGGGAATVCGCAGGGT